MILKLVSGSPLINSMTPAEMQKEIPKLRAEIERLRTALTKIKSALEGGALVPLDGYSDEIDCLKVIDAALNDQQSVTTEKNDGR
jgi:hypothetical protein